MNENDSISIPTLHAIPRISADTMARLLVGRLQHSRITKDILCLLKKELNVFNTEAKTWEKLK